MKESSVPLSPLEFSEIMQIVQDMSGSISRIADIMVQATLRLADQFDDDEIASNAKILRELRADLDKLNKEADI